jgi:methyl-accepting chemotaxis protein
MAGGQPTKNRFLKLLRKTASRSQRTPGRSAENDGALWTTHERASAAARLGAEAAQRVASALAKSRATMDAIADQARATSARREEVERALARLGDAFERLNLVALNAGLEGARLGETGGRSLSLVGDEIRSHVERGTAAAREVGDLAREAAREASAIGLRVDEVRALGSEVGADASRVAGAMTETERALAELSERLRKATGTDPETAKAIADATEHGRALVAALGTLTGRVPRAILVNALRPVLEPLLRVVVEDEAEEEERG